MMNQRTSFLTRFMAMAMALVLVISGVGPAIATRVSADNIDGNYQDVTAGEAVQDVNSGSKGSFVTDLYTVIADNFGNDVAKAVLKSGALKGNEIVSLEKPEAADAEALLTLANGLLEAQPFDAQYNGLSWEPYKYGADAETAFGAGATTAQWASNTAKVQYILYLNNYTADEVTAIMEQVTAIKSDAETQYATMERLNGYYSDMGELTKFMLAGVNAMAAIYNYYPEDPGKTAEMQAYFTNLISGIMTENIAEGDTNLKIYNMLTAYRNVNDGGLRYYFGNAAEIIAEVESLSAALTGLVGDAEKEECLGMLLGLFGKEAYVEKIARLGTVMYEVGRDLTLPNEMIDVNSENLGKLLTAVAAEGEAAAAAPITAPVLLSDKLTVTDTSTRVIQLSVEIGGERVTFTTEGVTAGTIVTAEMVNELEAKAADHVAAVLGAKAPYYNISVSSNLEEMVGQPLTASVIVVETCTPIEYTVTVAGETHVVTIEDMEIALPKHPEAPDRQYEFTVGGETFMSSTYTFTTEHLDSLFVGEAYAIDSTVINVANQKLEGIIEALQELNSVNTYTLHYTEVDGNLIPSALVVDVAGNSNGLSAFVTDMVSCFGDEFAYVGLNNDGLIYINQENALELSLQTMINAVMQDDEFSTETLIALGENGSGTVFTASLQLGQSAAAEDQFFAGYDIDFVLNMKSVPAEMEDVAKVLNLTDRAVSFNTKNDTLHMDLTMPEEMYAAYLYTMVCHGDLDKANLNEINTQIAFDYMFDWYVAVLNEDITTTTFQNTLEMMDLIAYDHIPDADLTQYEGYYQRVMNYLRSGAVNIEKSEEDVSLTVSVEGADILNALARLGMDLSGSEAANMIAELKEGGRLAVTASVSLTNANTDYEAMVVDVRADGSNIGTAILNKFDMTTNLAARVEQLAGAASITLIDDVTGDMTFDAMTLIDLNGHTINGNITANAKVIILDSVIDNALNCGGVNGELSGNFTILAGKYTNNGEKYDVSRYLRDGYVQNEEGAVHNAMYQIVNEDGVVTFEINTDYRADVQGYLPDVYAMATNIVVDILANYHTSAALTIDGEMIYDFTVNDLLGLLADGATPTALVNTGLNFVKADGVEYLINATIAELLDFGANADALHTGDVVASFDIESARWAFDINHVNEGNNDYLSGGLAANFEDTEEYTINIKFNDGPKTELVADIADYLDYIVLDETYGVVDLVQPVYAGGTLSLAGSADALLSLNLCDDFHLTMITTALIMGNPDRTAELLTALYGSDEDLKVAIDATTVEEVCNAMNAVIEAGSWAAIVERLGLSLPLNDQLMEKVYNGFSLIAAKALNVLSNYRGDCLIGSLDADNNGIYEISFSRGVDGDVTEPWTGRDYTLDVDYSATLTVKVNLFCRWGDVNHDGKVNSKDATLILQRAVGLEYTAYFCEIRSNVNGDYIHAEDGSLIPVYNSKDATLILQYATELIERFPVEE